MKFTSIFGEEFTHWFPLYVNKEHFKRSKDEIASTISMLCAEPNQSNFIAFKAENALKVLPAILVKTIIKFLKGNVHESLAAIDCYCQFYWLFMNLLSEYPELQTAIDD